MLEPGPGRVLGTTITPSEITTLHTMINLFIVTHITSTHGSSEKLNWEYSGIYKLTAHLIFNAGDYSETKFVLAGCLVISPRLVPGPPEALLTTNNHYPVNTRVINIQAFK